MVDRPLEQRLSNPYHGCGCLPCGLGTRGTTGPPEARIDPSPIDSWWLVDLVWSGQLVACGLGTWWGFRQLVAYRTGGEAEVPVGSLPGPGSALGGA